jgi:hypothetical protein
MLIKIKNFRAIENQEVKRLRLQSFTAQTAQENQVSYMLCRHSKTLSSTQIRRPVAFSISDSQVWAALAINFN